MMADIAGMCILRSTFSEFGNESRTNLFLIRTKNNKNMWA